MDIFKESPRDWWLVAVVALLSIGANLPREWTDLINLDRRYLLGGLIAVIGVALVKYLKFTLILVVVLLAIGANLPADVAKEFNIDPQIMLFGLVAMIVTSLINRVLKLPTGLEKGGRSKMAHGAAALFTAILKGRIAVVQWLLDQGVSANARTTAPRERDSNSNATTSRAATAAPISTGSDTSGSKARPKFIASPSLPGLTRQSSQLVREPKSGCPGQARA